MLTSPGRRSALVWSRGELRRLPAGLVLGVPTDLDALAASGIVERRRRGPGRAATSTPPPRRPASRPVTPTATATSPSASSSGAGSATRSTNSSCPRCCPGVNAGDADQLSLAAGAAQLAGAARRHPSLIRGLRDQQQAARDAGADPTAPVFHGIPVGTQTLTDLLLARLTGGGRRRSTCRARSSRHRAGRRRPRLRGAHAAVGPIEADRVVLCTAGAGLRPPPRRPRARPPPRAWPRSSTRRPPWSPWPCRGPALDHPLDASGFLVGAADRLPALTACSWASAKWAHLADPDVAVLRVSAGRHGDTAALELSDGSSSTPRSSTWRRRWAWSGRPVEAPGDPLVRRPPPVPARPPRPGAGVAGGGGRRRPRCGAGRRGLRRARPPGLHPTGPGRAAAVVALGD